MDLKGGTTNQVLAKNSDTDMDFKWVADAAGMTNPMTTTGDTIYSSSGSTPARLGIGTAGQVMGIAAGIPAWVAAPSGAIKQVVFAEYSTVTSTNTTTLTDIGLSATITPSSASSRIIVLAQASWSQSAPSQSDVGVKAALLRGATNILSKPTASAGYFQLFGNTQAKSIQGVLSLMDYDDPATTSATTYKVQGASYDYADCQWQPSSSKSTLILIEVLF
jgi:hypothetical protein